MKKDTASIFENGIKEMQIKGTRRFDNVNQEAEMLTRKAGMASLNKIKPGFANMKLEWF